MTPDIQATINRLKELDQKATPAPWKAIEGDDDGPTEVALLNSAGTYQDAVFYPATDSIPDFSDYHIAPDIAFLVELRNAYTALIHRHRQSNRPRTNPVGRPRPSHRRRNNPSRGRNEEVGRDI